MKSILFFIILFFICPYNVYSQNENKIDTIYKQEFKDFTLFLIRDDSNEEVGYWKTTLVDKNTNTSNIINIDAYSKEHFMYSYRGGGAFYLNNIIEAYRIKNKLHIFYSTWGKVKLFVFDLVDETAKNYLIGGFPCILSSGGHFGIIDFHKTNDFFYFSIIVGQRAGEKVNIVGYYNIKEDNLHLYNFMDNSTKWKFDSKETSKMIEENKDISLNIKEALIERELIKDNTEIKYLFQLKTRHLSYIWYAEHNMYIIRLIRYDHSANKWIIGGYSDINADLYRKD